MTKRYDPEDPVEMDKWTRKHFNITGETTDAFLIRTGYFADTPWGFSQRMTAALAWIAPQVTPNTRAIFDELSAIVVELSRTTSPFQPVDPSAANMPGQYPALLATSDPAFQRPTPPRRPEPLTAADIAPQQLKAELLFEQAKAIHRLQPELDAQMKYKQTQSANAKKTRALDEHDCRSLAKLYWERKDAGTFRGTVKELMRRYGISANTITRIAKEYKSN
jgi:hypothetical protein